MSDFQQPDQPAAAQARRGVDLADIGAAHDEIVAAVRAVPDAALDWQPGDGAWSLRQVIGHLAHASDFYIMVVDEVRARNFELVSLHRDLEGWRRMRAVDIAAEQCATVSALLDLFESEYQRMLEHFNALTLAELDRPFALESSQSTHTTTLRERAVRNSATHLREHLPQLADTLSRWRAAHRT